MLGKIGKAAQSHGLSHKSQVLEHHSLLDRRHLGTHQFEPLYGYNTATLWIVL
ncbi:MAG: hypothetical protein O7B35_02830 [Deltaproteobacteria bacterium]|nr:hypothetical protein [Deltaproteobacteria bacterium]